MKPGRRHGLTNPQLVLEPQDLVRRLSAPTLVDDPHPQPAVGGEHDPEHDVGEPWLGVLVVVMEDAARGEALRDRRLARSLELRLSGAGKAWAARELSQQRQLL